MPFLRKAGPRSPPRPAFDKCRVIFFFSLPFILLFFPPIPRSVGAGEMPPERPAPRNKAKSYFSQNRQTALAANFQISILRANMRQFEIMRPDYSIQ